MASFEDASGSKSARHSQGVETGREGVRGLFRKCLRNARAVQRRLNLRNALTIASATHVGCLRDHNEDSIAVDGDLGIAILADGMGGYNAGEVASGMAVTELMSELKAALGNSIPDPDSAGHTADSPVTLLRDSIARTNVAIFHAGHTHPQYAGMGTTLVTTLFQDNRVAIAHVGDSRVYRLRSESFDQLTCDHSLLQEQIDSGLLARGQAHLSQSKGLLTRAVGIDRSVVPEIQIHTVLPNNVYMLCSDGLTDMVSDEEMQLVVSSLRDKLQTAADHLVRMANDNGGRDNISVILVRVLQPFPATVGFFAKVNSWIAK